jgi:hypothetical protein
MYWHFLIGMPDGSPAVVVGTGSDDPAATETNVPSCCF